MFFLYICIYIRYPVLPSCGSASGGLTCVARYVDPHGRALPLPRPSLLRGAAGAVEVGQGEAAALGRQLGEVELRVVLGSLHQRLEVEATVDQAVLHAEVVSSGQGLVAGGAGEAAQVVHRVPGPHHHLRGGNAQVAASAPLHGEPSGTDTPSGHFLIHRAEGTQKTRDDRGQHDTTNADRHRCAQRTPGVCACLWVCYNEVTLQV